VKLAIGVIVSAGFRADTDFLFGRAPEEEVDEHGKRVRKPYPPEGLFALAASVQTGAVNASLPTHLKVTDCRTIMSRKFPTDVARNEICADALDQGCDYLLFLDADMVHPVSMVARLLSHEKPVITARYHLKKHPFGAVAYVKHRTDDGPHRYSTVHFGRGVFEIERGGAGALLIRRDVLQIIKARQWAQWDHAMKETARVSPTTKELLDVPPEPTCEWFRYQRGPTPPHLMTVSEDFWFYQQAREAGFKCYVDWDIDIPHIGPMAIDGSFNAPFLHTQMSEYENPASRQRILDSTVVCGYPDGMVLGEDAARIPAYQVTEGER
jgi:hypothetical protein